MKYVLAISYALGFAACGANEYPEENAPHALSLRLGSAQVTIGSLSVEHPELNGISVGKDCPADTLCIRSSFVGENQLAHIVVDHPDLMGLTSSRQGRLYRIQSSIPKVRLEADLIEVSKNLAAQVDTDVLKDFMAIFLAKRI